MKEEYCNKCRICKKRKKVHELEHYLRECSIIGKYRNIIENVGRILEEAERFLDLDFLIEIIENHKDNPIV